MGNTESPYQEYICPVCKSHLVFVLQTAPRSALSESDYDDNTTTTQDTEQETLALNPDFVPASEIVKYPDPTPELLRAGVNLTSLEISPVSVRTLHPIEKPEWKRVSHTLERIGFKWIKAGSASRWQRGGTRP